MQPKSKQPLFYLFFILFVSSWLATPTLEAGSWGKSDKTIEYAKTQWNPIYFDMNNVNFHALVPNCTGTVMQNGMTSFEGSIKEGNAIYLVNVQFFNPPKTFAEFFKMVQAANPDFIVKPVAAKQKGILFAVDLISTKKDLNGYWKFLSTKNGLIEMATGDSDEGRRLYFFDSLVIN